jgi:uncharacterized protein (DUF1786 family)
MMTEFTLTRTGDRPLTFAGEVVAEASSHVPVNGGPLQNRWHEVAVYRAGTGALVAAVTFRSRWQGEFDHHTATALPAADDLVAFLTAEYQPLMWGQGLMHPLMKWAFVLSEQLN